MILFVIKLSSKSTLQLPFLSFLKSKIIMFGNLPSLIMFSLSLPDLHETDWLSFDYRVSVLRPAYNLPKADVRKAGYRRILGWSYGNDSQTILCGSGEIFEVSPARCDFRGLFLNIRNGPN